MLIVMAGLPGVGKSAVAVKLARSLGCALLSVDPIEAAIWRAGVSRTEPTGLAAYVIAESLAHEQLSIGRDAIIDAVNDDVGARHQWRSLAATVSQPLALIEVFCSDDAVHQARLAGRQRPADFPEPTWAAVVDRRAALPHWDEPRLRLDSMEPLDRNVDMALRYIERVRHSHTEAAPT